MIWLRAAEKSEPKVERMKPITTYFYMILISGALLIMASSDLQAQENRMAESEPQVASELSEMPEPAPGRFRYLPVVPADDSNRKIVAPTKETEESEIDLTGDTLDIMDLPLTDELLFRYVFDTVTGRVLYLSVFQNGEVAYADRFQHNIGFIEDADSVPFARFMNLDINDNGRLDFILESYSGGVHCCYETLFFEYDKAGQFSLVDTVPSRHTPLEFSNFDSDSAFEFQLIDWTYDYGLVPFSHAPRPTVVFDYSDETSDYEVSLRHLDTTVDDNELMSRGAEIRNDKAGWKVADVHPRLLRIVVEELLYGGNGDMIEPFVRVAWPEDDKERADWFLAELSETMVHSPYWSALETVNGWTTSGIPFVTNQQTKQNKASSLPAAPETDAKEGAGQREKEAAAAVMAIEKPLVTNRSADKTHALESNGKNSHYIEQKQDDKDKTSSGLSVKERDDQAEKSSRSSVQEGLDDEAQMGMMPPPAQVKKVWTFGRGGEDN